MSDYKDFLTLAESRYSVRQYSPRPVEEDVMARILRAGQVAPTAANRQPQRIFVLKSDAALDKVRSVTRFHFNAPMVLLVCSDTSRSYKTMDGEDSGPVDAAIITTHMMMAAFDEGVGTCWVRGFDANQVASVFDLPRNLRPVAMLPMGYPAEDSHPWPGAHESRLPLEETVHYL